MSNKNIIIIVLLIILILICRNNIFETFQQNDTVDLRGQLVAPYNLKTSDKYDIGNIVLDQIGKNSGLHSKIGEALDLATLSQYINDGIDGDKGIRGEKGNIGSKGPQGEPGIVKQGEFQVVTGDRGPKGEQGEAGTDGAKGSKGERGPAGTASQKGEKGEAGGTGPAGPRGEVGPMGPRGESGTRGPVGPAASYSSITQDTSGNIGIGPSGFDAQSKLHVNGHFILEDGNKNSVINTGENGNFYFRKLGANYAQNGQGGSQDLMVVKNDGNIGIGTSNPTEKLVIGGDNSKICIGETCIDEHRLKKLLNPMTVNTTSSLSKKVRYVRVQSNRHWMHFKKFFVYTTDGIELIHEKIPGVSDNGAQHNIGVTAHGNGFKYKIPNSSIYSSGGPWHHALHGGHRHAYKVREPYSDNSHHRHAEHYYHSTGGWQWWEVDLGKEYEISRVQYDYRHNYERQWVNEQDRLQLYDGSKNKFFDKSLHEHNAFFGYAVHTIWNF